MKTWVPPAGGGGALRVGVPWEEGSRAGCSCQPWREVFACYVASANRQTVHNSAKHLQHSRLIKSEQQ